MTAPRPRTASWTLSALGALGALAASGCALDFDQFLRAGTDAGTDLDEAAPHERDGARAETATTTPGPGPCARPVVYGALEQLDVTDAPGRVLRVSLAQGAPQRCDDLSGRGRLWPHARAVAVLSNGLVGYASRTGVQLLDEETDEVVGEDRTNDPSLEPHELVVVRTERGAEDLAAAMYRLGTSVAGVFSALRRYDDATLRTARDYGASDAPFAGARVRSVSSHPSVPEAVLTLPETVTDTMAFTAPLGEGATRSAFVPRRTNEPLVALAAAPARGATPLRVVFTMLERETPQQVLLTENHPLQWVSGMSGCMAEHCAGSSPEVIHAIADPVERRSVLLSCGGGVERAIVRLRFDPGPREARCEVLLAPPTGRGRLRLWRLAAAP